MATRIEKIGTVMRSRELTCYSIRIQQPRDGSADSNFDLQLGLLAIFGYSLTHQRHREASYQGHHEA
ncbi:hypothetical protein M413DRAFT_337142 [Hebeloma cylindrosporum]|uniref:Uncharacterized protein n=1 Tax=Hebeloma cylindrosporum TaxID=76867 RepID=A0A0C3C8V8_HEBCY|nr:hypothetical protein M413DRAFT_337142 [Hebeloma cylindrosporum h7]